MQVKLSKKVMLGLMALALASIFIVGLLIVTRPEPDPFQASAVTDPTFPSLTYSIQTFTWWDGGQVGVHLDWVRLMSYSHIKQTFAWRDLEPEQGVWDWSQSDRIMWEVGRRDLRVVARLGQVPDWAQPQAYRDADIEEDERHDVPASNMDDWRNYCYTLADRYKDSNIVAYQVWNEPNLTREWGNQRPDPAAYVDLLAVCSEAIRDADPTAIIISAGLAPTGNNDDIAIPDDVYLDEMYRHGFQQYVDVVGVHAPGFAPPEYGPDDAEADGVGRWFTFRRVEDLRKIMIQHGDAARQMAILEFGYTTDTQNPDYAWYAVTEDEQADMLLRAYDYAIENWRPWVGLMSLIYMPNPSWTEENEEYWWSISKPDVNAHRPAFFVLANMSKTCGDFFIPARDPNSPVSLGLEPAPICP